MNPLESWFTLRGWKPFDFQRRAWRAYLDGCSGLVHAPTGTGKTHAVWGGPLLEWIDEHPSDAQPLAAPPLRVLWITPLRALASDTVVSLREAVEGLGLPWTVELRTGDTTQAVRARQRKQLPTALVTTPESLSLLLSYADHERLFRDLRCVVVDEWHELMGNKRGVQTQLCLAALRTLRPEVRMWGLSATLGNLDEAMATLLGPRLDRDRAQLIHGDHAKAIEIDTLRPDDLDRFPWAGHLGTRMLPEVLRRLDEANSTLLFTNTRSQAEIWFQQILRAAPELLGHVALHHGSLDRDVRNEVEDMLREGRLRAVVCTSSLDLGVDFTPVDQVIQIGSPKGVARLLQRAGRSGHQPGAVSRVLGVPTNALELLEFAAARDALRARRIEARLPPARSMDVLVQHLVTRALGGGFEADAMREEVRVTHAFADLTDEQWQWALDFVSRGGETLQAYPQYARVAERDGRHIVDSPPIGRRHRMSIGTITADASVRVKFAGGKLLGTIEESFISRLRPGDRFVFAGRVLELVRVREMTATVRAAKKGKGAVPRWMGGRSPLSHQLADAVRTKIDEARRGVFDCDEMRLVRPLLELQAAWSILPAPDELLIEHHRSRDGRHIFAYPLAGRLVHEGLAALLAFRITRTRPISITVSANDYGLELLSAQALPTDEPTWRALLSTDDLLDDLLACINASQLARRHFRDIARIAGLVFTGFPGEARPNRHLQASSDLFYDVFRDFDPENLLLEQARREVLEGELEFVRLRAALERAADQTIRPVGIKRLTPLAFPLWVETIRSQSISSETWHDRVQRMVARLEAAAQDEDNNRQEADGAEHPVGG